MTKMLLSPVVGMHLPGFVSFSHSSELLVNYAIDVLCASRYSSIRMAAAPFKGHQDHSFVYDKHIL